MQTFCSTIENRTPQEKISSSFSGPKIVFSEIFADYFYDNLILSCLLIIALLYAPN